MSRGTALPDPREGGIPLSEWEWDVVTALEQQIDLEGPGEPAPEVVLLTYARQVAVWLRWLLDPKLDGLPMPPLLPPRRPRTVQPRGPRR